jgi:hypothetical protein
VWHQADHIPAFIANAGDVVEGAVRVAVDVTENHLAVALQATQRVLVGNVAALAVLQHEVDDLAHPEVGRPRGIHRLDLQILVLADEDTDVVTDQGARQQVRLAENLEAITDAEHRHPSVSGLDHLSHHRREPGDRPTAQIITVGKPARQDHCIDAVKVVATVPQ